MKLDNQTVAKRYATALFDVVSERNQLDEVANQLGQIKQAFEQNPAYLAFLTTNRIKPDVRKQAVLALVKDANDVVKNLVAMVFDYKRIENLQAIIDQYQRLVDHYHKVVRATVTTAVPLTPDQAKRLADTFAKVVAANEVKLDQQLDPKILGGVILRSDSYIYDGSIKTKIERIKQLLLK